MGKKIVVIGAGPGGYVAALRAADLGAQVTIVEKENLGGTCLNHGCIPSKIMNHSADILLKLKGAKEFGINLEGKLSPDIQALMKKKNKVLEIQRKGIDSLLSSRSVAIERGRAVIKGSGLVEIILDDGHSKQIEYDKLIIAAGTAPLNVQAFPFDHENILSSNDMLCLEKIPESIVIVGGGVIGCEFAFIFSALGSRVTVVEAMSRLLPLPMVDTECSKLLLKEMKKKKIKVLCDTIVKSAHKDKNGLSIHLGISEFTDNPKPLKLKTDVIEAEKMAVCIGRASLAGELGLDNISLETDKYGWIEVNEKMQTKIDDVYAIGDILGPEKAMLAHVASHEGMVAAANAMGIEESMDYDVIPGAVFTMPEIGMVGLSEKTAIDKGYEIETFSVNFRSLGKAHATGELAGSAKMIMEKKSGRVLGVHITGPRATDLIAEACLAMRNDLTASQIAHTIHAHPTFGEIMGELSLKACGIPVHG